MTLWSAPGRLGLSYPGSWKICKSFLNFGSDNFLLWDVNNLRLFVSHPRQKLLFQSSINFFLKRLSKINIWFLPEWLTGCLWHAAPYSFINCFINHFIFNRSRINGLKQSIALIIKINRVPKEVLRLRIGFLSLIFESCRHTPTPVTM